MLVIVLCSLLFEATTAHALGFRRKRQPRPPTAVGADRVREEAATLQPTIVHVTDLGMRESGILNKSRPHVDTISGAQPFRQRVTNWFLKPFRGPNSATTQLMSDICLQNFTNMT